MTVFRDSVFENGKAKREGPTGLRGVANSYVNAFR
jgi:hypothetical protein